MADTLESLELEVSYKASSAASKLKEVTSAVKKLSSTLKTQDATKGLSKLGNTASKASTRLSTLFNSIKRIAFYRIIRSAIKAVTEALQEGVENAYRYSKATGGDIAASFDKLSSTSYKMKNQLGSAWAEVISSAEPILLRLIDLVTRAADVLSHFFAALEGKNTYLKAIDYSKEWAETTKSGASAAKEWRNQILGFDEINRLEEPSGGGGGGGSNLPDYEKMFEDVAVNEKLAKAVEPLRKVFEFLSSGNPFLGSAGGMLVGWILDFVEIAKEKLPEVWETVKSVFGNAGKWFNDNVITPIKNVFKPIVDFIGGVFKDVVLVIQAVFIVVTDWVRNNIIDPITNYFKNLVDNTQQRATELWDKIKSLISSVSPYVQEKIIKPVADKFNSLRTKVSEIANAMSDSIKTPFRNGMNTVIGYVETAINWIIQKINNFISTINSVVSWASRITGKEGYLFGSISYVSFQRLGGEASTESSPFRSARTTGIQEYATGGFPEDGLFFANHGEMVGQFSNGRTAVANNDQIVEGIRAGVYDAVVSAMSSSNSGTPIPIEIDGRRLAEILFPYNRMVDARHGTSLINA